MLQAKFVLGTCKFSCSCLLHILFDFTFFMSEDANTGDHGGSYQESFMKYFQNLITPMLVIGLFLSSFSFGPREQQQVSYMSYYTSGLGFVGGIGQCFSFFFVSLFEKYVELSRASCSHIFKFLLI